MIPRGLTEAFLLLALDGVPRLELWEIVPDPMTPTPIVQRVAPLYSQLDATAVEFLSPALIAVTAKSGAITLLSTKYACLPCEAYDLHAPSDELLTTRTQRPRARSARKRGKCCCGM